MSPYYEALMRHQRLNLKIEQYKVGLVILCEDINVLSVIWVSILVLDILPWLRVPPCQCTLRLAKTSVIFEWISTIMS